MKRYPDELFENLAADYERLRSRKKVAELYGCSPSLIEKKMHQMGIKGVSYSEGASTYWSRPENREASRRRLIEWFEKGRKMKRPTNLEKILGSALEKHHIGFEFQKPIGGRYIVDFLIAGTHVVVEADGYQHRLKREAARDKKRDADLNAWGYTVLHFSGQQLHANADYCVDLVKTELEARSEEPSTTLANWDFLRGKNNPMYGKKMSKESRRKMSEAAKRRWQDPEQREMLTRRIRDGQSSPECRRKMRESHLGKRKSPQAKAKWAASYRRAIEDRQRTKAQIVIQSELAGNSESPAEMIGPQH